MFVGRKRELETLESLYQTHGFGMCVITGRRRVGKSTLINAFIKDKKAIFYTAVKVGAERNLELFASQVTNILDPTLTDIRFTSKHAIFDYISAKLPEEKTILVIDELPYWAEKDESLLSVLQKYIDTKWQNKNLMIILCGSSLSFMENKVLSEKSPLFGRRNAQIALKPFNYREAALFVPNYSREDQAICYGITGGVAKYLSLIDSNKNLDENIKNLFFHPEGYLYDETRNLLTQEFSDITLVNNIIEQIASGENTVNLIAAKVHEKEATVLYSLEKLIQVDLVEKKRCITEEKNKKKTHYVLKDTMFKFWYTFIPKAHSVIAIGMGNVYYEKVVRPKLHAFMGSVFEEMCRYFTLEQSIQGKLNGFFTEIGTWWGIENIKKKSNETIRQSADIDVVALSPFDRTSVIGECKFKNEKIDKEVYLTLLRRGSLLSAKYPIAQYLFFSLSGYSDWVQANKKDHVLLFSLEDLYQ